MSEHRSDDWTSGTLFTSGNWSDEAQSAQIFDQLIEQSGFFRVYREVPGFYVQPRIGQELHSPRIDRLLIPTEELTRHGWSQGIIGVELKRSGIKAGPVLSQMFDYSRAAWRLNALGGVDVWLRWIFLWPLHQVHCTWASLMAQNRLGSCDSTPWAKLIFHSGEVLILRINADGSVICGNPKNGNRIGSR